jgi:hypothetical protein
VEVINVIKCPSATSFQPSSWQDEQVTESQSAPVPPSFAGLQIMGAWLTSLDKVTFDQTLAFARQAIGPTCDPSNGSHAVVLREWLNDWGCRLRYPKTGDSSDPFVTNIAAWWQQFAHTLPPSVRTIDQIRDAEIEAVADAYEALRQLPASPPEARRRRYIGSTAAAKLIFFLRPETVTAWDRRIARHFGDGHGRAGFTAHLARCRGWAQAINCDAAAVGIPPNMIGSSVSRPDSSIAKLIDEYLYQVISRGKRF